MSNYAGFLYSLKKSCEEAICIINDSCKNSNDKGLYQDVHHKLGTAVHWIMDCWERIEKSGIRTSETDKEFFRAFRWINNELKHNPNVIYLHRRIGSSTYPIVYPYRFGEAIIEWIKTDKQTNGGYENQLNCYKKYLEGSRVNNALEKAQRLIEIYIEAIDKNKSN